MNTSSKKLSALILAFSFLIPIFAPVASNADYIQPDAVIIKTKAYVPQETDFPLGAYEYVVSWEGIPVAKATIDVASQNEQGVNYFAVKARAVTGKIISIFYRLRHESQSIFRTDRLTPIKFVSSQTENSRAKFREVRFEDSGLIAARLWKKGENKPEEEITFRSDNATFDPISAAFLARSLPVTEGEELVFDVFNGKHRFLITLRVDGKEKIRVNGKRVEAYRVRPDVKKLTDTEGEKRLRSATLWVSTDEKREVLKVESKVLVGSIRAELIKFTPIGPLTDPQSVRAALSSQSDDASANKKAASN